MNMKKSAECETYLLCVFVFRHAWKVILKIILFPKKNTELYENNDGIRISRSLIRVEMREIFF